MFAVPWKQTQLVWDGVSNWRFLSTLLLKTEWVDLSSPCLSVSIRARVLIMITLWLLIQEISRPWTNFQALSRKWRIINWDINHLNFEHKFNLDFIYNKRYHYNLVNIVKLTIYINPIFKGRFRNPLGGILFRVPLKWCPDGLCNCAAALILCPDNWARSALWLWIALAPSWEILFFSYLFCEWEVIVMQRSTAIYRPIFQQSHFAWKLVTSAWSYFFHKRPKYLKHFRQNFKSKAFL